MAPSWLSLAESRLSTKAFAVLVTVFNVLFANFGETTVTYYQEIKEEPGLGMETKSLFSLQQGHILLFLRAYLGMFFQASNSTTAVPW